MRVWRRQALCTAGGDVQGVAVKGRLAVSPSHRETQATTPRPRGTENGLQQRPAPVFTAAGRPSTPAYPQAEGAENAVPCIQVNTPPATPPAHPASVSPCGVGCSQAHPLSSPCPPCSPPVRHHYGEVRVPGLHSPACVSAVTFRRVWSLGHIFLGRRVPSGGHIGSFRELSGETGNWAGPQGQGPEARDCLGTETYLQKSWEDRGRKHFKQGAWGWGGVGISDL